MWRQPVETSLAPARPWRTSPIGRVRLRIPRCSNDHRSYKGRLPLPRPRSESMHRNQKAQTPPGSLRSPPRAYFASSNLSAEPARNGKTPCNLKIRTPLVRKCRLSPGPAAFRKSAQTQSPQTRRPDGPMVGGVTLPDIQNFVYCSCGRCQTCRVSGQFLGRPTRLPAGGQA
jgi:hypothetical protein